MIGALAIATAAVALFAFPAFAFVLMKVVESRFKNSSERPEPPRPNKADRNIPGGKSGKSN